MHDHVLDVGVRVDHVSDRGRLHCDRPVSLSVEMVGKVEKLHADAAGHRGEEHQQIRGNDNATCKA